MIKKLLSALFITGVLTAVWASGALAAMMVDEDFEDVTLSGLLEQGWTLDQRDTENVNAKAITTQDGGVVIEQMGANQNQLIRTPTSPVTADSYLEFTLTNQSPTDGQNYPIHVQFNYENTYRIWLQISATGMVGQSPTTVTGVDGTVPGVSQGNTRTYILHARAGGAFDIYTRENAETAFVKAGSGTAQETAGQIQGGGFGYISGIRTGDKWKLEEVRLFTAGTYKAGEKVTLNADGSLTVRVDMLTGNALTGFEQLIRGYLALYDSEDKMQVVRWQDSSLAVVGETGAEMTIPAADVPDSVLAGGYAKFYIWDRERQPLAAPAELRF